jgi:ribosome-binding ATPase YchF (GTP1/OBG family)
VLNEGKPVRTMDLSKEELAPAQAAVPDHGQARHVRRQRERDGFENNPFLDRLNEYAATQNAPVVAICAKMEADMADMSDEDRALFLARDGPGRTRPEPPDPCRLQAAGPADLLHRRREGGARLDHPHRRHRSRRRPA